MAVCIGLERSQGAAVTLVGSLNFLRTLSLYLCLLLNRRKTSLSSLRPGSLNSMLCLQPATEGALDLAYALCSLKGYF